MASRMYLIRVNLEKYLGPYSLDDIRSAYRKMEFGLQDEIASSLNEWVAFDDLDKMKKIYPELMYLIKNDILSGWGVSGKASSIEGLPSFKHQKPMAKKFASNFAIFIFMAALGGVAFFTSRSWFEKKFQQYLGGPSYSQATEMLKRGHHSAFIAYIKKNESHIQLKAQNRGSLKNWLPVLRAYAFLTVGEISWVKKSLLRGKDLFAPKDCSLVAWSGRWQTSVEHWGKFVNGQAMPQDDWSKILAWDPLWMKRRHGSGGWHYPQSYYEGCLLMAEQALKAIQVREKTNLALKEVMLARIHWQLDFLSEKSRVGDLAMFGTLWHLSCIESASTSASLEDCQTTEEIARAWKSLLDFRSEMRELSFILSTEDIGATQVKQIVILLNQQTDREPFTRFDYTPEHKFYRQVVTLGGDIEKALGFAESRFINVNFQSLLH